VKVDLNRFKEVFFEESLEGLAVMESGLLALADAVNGKGAADEETIHEVFRAAHSMKGGSGVFGFTELTELTHLLETLLEDLRNGTRTITTEITRLLLDSVDCLRSILDAKRGGTEVDGAWVKAVGERLRAVLASGKPAAGGGAHPERAAQTAGTAEQWRILFSPFPHFLHTGNDPLRILRELSQMGDLRVRPDVTGLPPLSKLNPEDLHITWDMELDGRASYRQIKEVFDWVEGDCEFLIEARPESEAASITAAPPESDPSEPARERRGAPRAAETSSIRVATDKVDAIINLVGELLITQSMLNQFGEHFEMSMLDQLRDGLALLARNTRELQETVLKIRMLPISFCFNRFPRLVHDLSAKLGKKINLKLSGEHTELDKTVLEKIADPLVHLVRNSMDHGIEMPEVRLAAGKPEAGTVHLDAAHQGGSIVVQISDDGAGLNTARILAKARQRGLVGPEETLPEERIHDLIFAPGFSTADQVTDLSGRGVGMDVVRRNVKELGGSIDIHSKSGLGTSFRIRLPLTLAILDGQLVSISGRTFVISLVSILESLQVKKEHVYKLVGGGEVYRLRDDYIPVVRLYQTFQMEPAIIDLELGLLVIVEAEGRKAGIFVDDLLAQQQVVIKSLEGNYQKVDGISGATILGDGTVALILDIPGILNMASARGTSDGAAPVPSAIREETHEYSY
jgi:two-component system, chemotaxis family, sensor kinase CheA